MTDVGINPIHMFPKKFRSSGHFDSFNKKAELTKPVLIWKRNILPVYVFEREGFEITYVLV